MKLIYTIMPRSLSAPSTLCRSLIVASLREVLVLQVCYLRVAFYVPHYEGVKVWSKLIFLTMPRSLSVAINTSAACMIMPRSLRALSTLFFFNRGICTSSTRSSCVLFACGC